MASRIRTTFSALRRVRQKALIGYLTAGYPNKSSFRTLVQVCEKAGLDILEIGVPFSDPIADGATIQHSSQIALRNGVTLSWILQQIRELRRSGCQIPLILMSYCNPIAAMGTDRFFQAARHSGVDGLIIPDLIHEEGKDYERAAKKSGVDFIYLVAPTSSTRRTSNISKKTTGFLYAVSMTGVTGTQAVSPVQASTFLRSVKRVSSAPVAVGFGITTPRQARELSRDADAVIVGSALVRTISSSQAPRYEGVTRFIRALKGALHAS